MIDLYEDEAKTIYESVHKVQTRYFGKDASGENLLNLQNELIKRLEDLGFAATVDVTPALEGLPISVRIDERLDTNPFDMEQKRWEVKRRIERKEADPDIEGMV